MRASTGRAIAGLTIGAAALLAVLAGCAEAPSPIAASRRCSDVRFPIYFQPGSDQLTPEGAAVIRAQAQRMAPCKVGTAEVLGLADAGASTDPLELSQKRASVVAQALAAAGLPAPSFDLVAEGASGSITPGGHKAPLHRRAEVVLHARPASAS